MNKEDLLVHFLLTQNNLRRQCVEKCITYTDTSGSISTEEEQCLAHCTEKLNHFWEAAKN